MVTIQSEIVRTQNAGLGTQRIGCLVGSRFGSCSSWSPRKVNSTSLGSECETISPGGDISISKVGMRLRNIDEKERRGDHTFS